MSNTTNFISVQNSFLNEVSSKSYFSKEEEILVFQNLENKRNLLLSFLITDKNFIQVILNYETSLLNHNIRAKTFFRFLNLKEKDFSDNNIIQSFSSFKEALKTKNPSVIINSLNKDLTISNELILFLLKIMRTPDKIDSYVSNIKETLTNQNENILSNIMSISIEEIDQQLDKKDKPNLSKYIEIKEIYLMSFSSIDIYDIEQIISDFKEIESEILESNIMLIISNVNKYAKNNMQRMDLIQEGSLGLIKAIHKFDIDRGFKFSTFATPWINQSLVKYMQNEKSMVQLPSHIKTKLYTINKEEKLFFLKNGKNASIDYLSKVTEISIEDIRYIKYVSQSDVSTTVYSDDGEEIDFLDTVTTHNEDHAFEQKDLDTKFIELLKEKISTDQLIVLELFYGLRQFEDETMKPTLVNLTKETGFSVNKVKKLLNIKRLSLDKDLQSLNDTYHSMV